MCKRKAEHIRMTGIGAKSYVKGHYRRMKNSTETMVKESKEMTERNKIYAFNKTEAQTRKRVTKLEDKKKTRGKFKRKLKTEF